MYLQSNGVTLNVLHYVFDLYFQGLEFLNAIISKTMKASEKCSRMTFIEDDILPSNGTICECCTTHSVALTKFSRSNFSSGYFDK